MRPPLKSIPSIRGLKESNDRLEASLSGIADPRAGVIMRLKHELAYCLSVMEREIVPPREGTNHERHMREIRELLK